MSRARNVTPLQTTRRLARINSLVTTLLTRDLGRDDVATLLAVTPSGARKYLGDLREAGVIQLARYEGGTAYSLGHPVYTMAMTAEQAQAYLADLAKSQPSRAAAKPSPSKSAMSIALRDPRRHIHLMADDVPFQIRLSRMPVMRDPLVAAFFGGAGQHEVRA